MRAIIFESLSEFRRKFTGPFLRRIGKKMYQTGTAVEGENASEDRLVPSLRKLTYAGFQPQLQAADFIAPNATIIGNVELGQKTSVWYGATLVGTKKISIGDNCIIQDRAHLSREISIGDNVFIGPNSIIQGSILNNRAFIGMGSTVRHSTVENGGFVAAGAVIADSVVVKEGEIWAGNPGKFLRNITPVQRQILREHLEQMKDLACIHSEETQKNARQVISNKTQPFEANNHDDFLDDLTQQSFYYSDIDEEFLEQRTLMKEDRTYFDMGKDYEPYEYNVSHMGEKFNVGVHGQQFKKVATKIKEKERFENDTNPWKSKF